eukprot:9345194-Alexandrium_andersonii.AAC.1
MAVIPLGPPPHKRHVHYAARRPGRKTAERRTGGRGERKDTHNGGTAPDVGLGLSPAKCNRFMAKDAA